MINYEFAHRSILHGLIFTCFERCLWLDANVYYLCAFYVSSWQSAPPMHAACSLNNGNHCYYRVLCELGPPTVNLPVNLIMETSYLYKHSMVN